MKTKGHAMTTKGNKLKANRRRLRSATLYTQTVECIARSVQSIRMDFSKGFCVKAHNWLDVYYMAMSAS